MLLSNGCARTERRGSISANRATMRPVLWARSDGYSASVQLPRLVRGDNWSWAHPRGSGCGRRRLGICFDGLLRLPVDWLTQGAGAPPHCVPKAFGSAVQMASPGLAPRAEWPELELVRLAYGVQVLPGCSEASLEMLADWAPWSGRSRRLPAKASARRPSEGHREWSSLPCKRSSDSSVSIGFLLLRAAGTLMWLEALAPPLLDRPTGLQQPAGWSLGRTNGGTFLQAEHASGC